MRPADLPGLLDLSLDQYLDILDWTGRQFWAGGKKSIPGELAPSLDRPRADSDRWLKTTAGRAQLMQETATALGRRRPRGLNAGRRAWA
ncbi:MAG: hypothetical protein V1816_08970 [Pseudomonadota bacterium]